MTISELRPVTMPDGRRLETYVSGPPDGEVLIYHTGTPSGGPLFSRTVKEAADRGLRVVTWSRPGYAGSTRLPDGEPVDGISTAGQQYQNANEYHSLTMD